MKTTLELEAALTQSLERHLGKETPPNLAEAIRYSLLAPGKRIRPRLALACARMLDLPMPASVPAALAIEMIHCFTLIHDDLPCMDDDDFRRGKPSNHKVHGEALALLAGDALMALAFDVLSEASQHVAPERFVLALREFLAATGPRGVIGGQAAESLLTQESALEDMRIMHSKKTGALFEAALLVPRELAGVTATSPEGRAIASFAARLGAGFQVADDLEDAETEAKSPTSILFYMTPRQAAESTARALEAGIAGLKQAWGSRADELTAIAGEVLGALQATATKASTP